MQIRFWIGRLFLVSSGDGRREDAEPRWWNLGEIDRLTDISHTRVTLSLPCRGLPSRNTRNSWLIGSFVTGGTTSRAGCDEKWTPNFKINEVAIKMSWWRAGEGQSELSQHVQFDYLDHQSSSSLGVSLRWRQRRGTWKALNWRVERSSRENYRITYYIVEDSFSFKRFGSSLFIDTSYESPTRRCR